MLLAIGQDSESLREVVVYKALYCDRKVWVRLKEMFFSTVLKDGIEVPRFKEISKEEAYAHGLMKWKNVSSVITQQQKWNCLC